MANEEHVTILRSVDSDHWNAWRTANPAIINPDISYYFGHVPKKLKDWNFDGVNFCNSKLSEANFEGCELENVNFSGADLSNANFENAILKNINFSGANLNSANFSKTIIKDSKFPNTHGDYVSFKGADLAECDFRGATLLQSTFAEKMLRVNFTDAKCKNNNGDELRECDSVIFHNCNFSGTSFKGTKFVNCSFEFVDLSNVILTSCEFKTPHRFYKVGGDGLIITLTKMEKSIFEGSNFQHSKIDQVDLRFAELSNTSFAGTHFFNSNLEASDFNHCNLESTAFATCILNCASFSSVTVNSHTHFPASAVRGLKIDRFTLECLNDYGGITKGAASELDIQDDLASLRRSYSGFMFWVHFWLFGIFLAPYVWFFCETWLMATKLHPVMSGRSIPIWEALIRYVWNGGERWREGWFISVNFVFFAIAFL